VGHRLEAATIRADRSVPNEGETVATNASEALGAQELAGCFVSPKGLTKKVTGATAAGMVAGVAGRAAANTALGTQAAPNFGMVGYLAVTATEFAIVKGKTGLLKPSVGSEVVARVPREQITAVELDGHMLTAALKIGFADGGSWLFEIPKMHRKNAEQLIRVLKPAG
jgi:hypothetical protein